MSRIYAQAMGTGHEYIGDLAASGITTGSFSTTGYSKLVGSVISNGSSRAGSGLRVEQSIDGTNWDFLSVSGVAACTATSPIIDVIGRFARVTFQSGENSSASLRMLWQLRPI